VTKSLFRIVAVLSVIPLFSACGKGNPIEPGKYDNSTVRNHMVLGAWSIEITGLDRIVQTADQAPYLDLVHILDEDPEGTEASMVVSTLGYDREAHMLSLGFEPVDLPPVLAPLVTAQSDPSLIRHRACFEAGGLPQLKIL